MLIITGETGAAPQEVQAAWEGPLTSIHYKALRHIRTTRRDCPVVPEQTRAWEAPAAHRFSISSVVLLLAGCFQVPRVTGRQMHVLRRSNRGGEGGMNGAREPQTRHVGKGTALATTVVAPQGTSPGSKQCLGRVYKGPLEIGT